MKKTIKKTSKSYKVFLVALLCLFLQGTCVLCLCTMPDFDSPSEDELENISFVAEDVIIEDRNTGLRELHDTTCIIYNGNDEYRLEKWHSIRDVKNEIKGKNIQITYFKEKDFLGVELNQIVELKTEERTVFSFDEYVEEKEVTFWKFLIFFVFMESVFCAIIVLLFRNSIFGFFRKVFKKQRHGEEEVHFVDDNAIEETPLEEQPKPKESRYLKWREKCRRGERKLAPLFLIASVLIFQGAAIDSLLTLPDLDFPKTEELKEISFVVENIDIPESSDDDHREDSCFIYNGGEEYVLLVDPSAKSIYQVRNQIIGKNVTITYAKEDISFSDNVINKIVEIKTDEETVLSLEEYTANRERLFKNRIWSAVGFEVLSVGAIFLWGRDTKLFFKKIVEKTRQRKQSKLNN